MRSVIVVALFSAAIVSCGTTNKSLKESGYKLLNAAQIQKLLDDSTILAKGIGKSSFAAYFTSDGKFRIRSFRAVSKVVHGRNKVIPSQKYEEVGKWRTKAPDKFCWTSLKYTRGTEVCHRWHNKGNDFRVVRKDETSIYEFEIVPGNPRKL